MIKSAQMEAATLFAENNPTLFSIEIKVDIVGFLHCAFQALRKDPGILEEITSDLDKHALEKKRERFAEAASGSRTTVMKFTVSPLFASQRYRAPGKRLRAFLSD